MCGILGYYASEIGQIGHLDRGLALLHHRGPDDSGSFISPHGLVGLAHARLAIQDLSPLGHQPMLSNDGSVALVFNGEIYNFRELRGELEADGECFIGHSDTEVLLRLLIASRDQANPALAVRRLNGIFAFALWDYSRELLWVVRDTNGVKPLYYSNVNGFFAFASELKALRCLVDFNEPDVVALDRYLTFLWAPGELTPAQNVFKLGPGEMLKVKDGKIVSHEGWCQGPISCAFPSKFYKQESAVKATEQLLRQAVHRQMSADVPVGAFLSGGLDSSAIVNFAREVSPRLQCFTIDVRSSSAEGFVDDLPYAQKVACHLGVPLSVVQVHAAQMAADLEAAVWQLDEPLADLAPLNVLYISRLARQQGIKVLLGGAGGDDLFSGYRRHIAIESEQWWRWLPRPLRLHLRSLTRHLPTSHPLTRRLRKVFAGAHLEGDARLVHYFKWIERSDLQALYTPSFRAALGQDRADNPMLEYLASLPSSTPTLERMLALEKRFFLVDHNLTYTDKMSMAVGVEVRVPFLDPDLVEFAAQMPQHFKQRGRQGKWILKKVMKPYLPKEVIYRPKSGFGAPLRRWLQLELRDWLADTLSVDRLKRRGLFEPQAVHQLIAANSEGRIDASYTLLSLACIEIWCNYFLDGAASPDLNSKSGVL